MGIGEAALRALWARTALRVTEDDRLQQGRGALDAGDVLQLRCFMRRYGQDLHAIGEPEVFCCLWSECFKGVRQQQLFDFAWFLVERLLHPRQNEALQRLREDHCPMRIQQVRASRSVVGWRRMP